MLLYAKNVGTATQDATNPYRRPVMREIKNILRSLQDIITYNSWSGDTPLETIHFAKIIFHGREFRSKGVNSFLDAARKSVLEQVEQYLIEIVEDHKAEEEKIKLRELEEQDKRTVEELLNSV